MNSPTLRPGQVPPAAQVARGLAARVFTEVLAPWVIVLLLPLSVAWQATRSLTATALWGLVVAMTSSIIPMGVIVWGARTGRWAGHHVTNREGRLVPFIVLIVMSAIGLTLLVLGDSPWPVIALDVAMLVMLVLTAAITTVWKISIHAAVAAGAVVILAATYHPLMWLLSPLVAGVGWSRVHLRDHTSAQVVGGTIAGIVGGSLYVGLL